MGTPCESTISFGSTVGCGVGVSVGVFVGGAGVGVGAGISVGGIGVSVAKGGISVGKFSGTNEVTVGQGVGVSDELHPTVKINRMVRVENRNIFEMVFIWLKISLSR